MSDPRRPVSFETYTTWSEGDPTWPHRQPRYAPRRPARRGRLIHVALFLATFLSTSWAGALNAGGDPLSNLSDLALGFPFAATLMTILFVHEMGHYSLARYHRVEATLPFFIPAPPIFFTGTFGAFIRMDASPPSRRALFDVGAAGPWAGLLVAIPAVFIGLHWSSVQPLGDFEGGLELGEPLLFQFLSHLAIGSVPDGMTVVLHPVALAGWVGFLVTFLNLLPIGQLDGGHVSYALLGRFHRVLARGFLLLILVLGVNGWGGWILWVCLLAWIGIDHPPTLDPWIGLDRRRIVGALATAAMFALTFMPVPLAPVQPPPRYEGEKVQVSWGPKQAIRRSPRVIIGATPRKPSTRIDHGQRRRIL